VNLQPYRPELNPQEAIWQHRRQNHPSKSVFAGYDAVVDACCAASMASMNQPDPITSIATREWAEAVTD
jgi:hypothetical protein